MGSVMVRGRAALLSLVAVLLLVPAVGACGGSSSPEAPAPGTALLRIGDLTVEAEVPQTPEAFKRGLSGRERMDEDRGMLFVYTSEGPYSFWMKDMLFPLDLVWISADLRVVDIIANVEPQPGVPDNDLTIYTPRSPALYTLELVGGVAEKHGLQVGDAVEIVLPEESEQAGGD